MAKNSAPESSADGAANNVSADLNWLLTWIGQAEPAAEASEGQPVDAAAPARAQSIQWLTLLPAVPAMQLLDSVAPESLQVANDDTTGKAEPAVEAAPLTISLEGPPKAEAKAELSSERNDEQTDEETDDSKAPLVNAVQPTVFVTVPRPVNPPAPAVAVAETPPSSIETRKTPLPGAPTEVPQPAQGLPRTPTKADKGELIWAADFVVAKNTLEPVEGDTMPRTPTALVESAAPAKGTAVETMPRREGSETGSRQQSAGEQRQGEKQAARPAEVERAEPAEPARPLDRHAPAAAKHEVFAVGPAAPVSIHTAPVASGDAIEATAAPAAIPVEIDTFRPLRPAQTATLYVDVPAAAGPGEAGTIRLAVTQRGDQVNVRLRSWDTGAAPIENERMQPLLQSLSDQGYEAAKKSIEHLDDRGAQTLEKIADKPLATAEASDSRNDRQSFQNADDRQRKNQERQQQAFLFLRRQAQNLNTEQFDLQAQLDGFNNSQQQGALR